MEYRQKAWSNHQKKHKRWSQHRKEANQRDEQHEIPAGAAKAWSQHRKEIERRVAASKGSRTEDREARNTSWSSKWRVD